MNTANPSLPVCPCNVCSAKIEFEPSRAGETIPCPHCGLDTILFLQPESKVQVEPMPDPILLSEPGAIITRTRILFFGRTFAMANVSSVRGVQTSPSRIGPVILVIVGLLCLATSVIAASAIMACGFLWLFLQKDSFGIVITAAGGEVTGFSTKDKKLADRILLAINQAIISRG